MRITAKRSLGQLLLLLIIFAVFGCRGKKEESPVIPPVTSPLSREYIGFGVVNVSFTHVTSEPGGNGSSIGYLRRGSQVRIIKRQQIKTGSAFSSWVLIEGDPQSGPQVGPQGGPQGWLKEEVLDIFETESRAKTASQAMN